MHALFELLKVSAIVSSKKQDFHQLCWLYQKNDTKIIWFFEWASHASFDKQAKPYNLNVWISIIIWFTYPLKNIALIFIGDINNLVFNLVNVKDLFWRLSQITKKNLVSSNHEMIQEGFNCSEHFTFINTTCKKYSH